MDVEEAAKEMHEPSPPQVEASVMEDERLESVAVTDTVKCEFLPELGHSQLLGGNSPVETKDDEAVAAEEGMSTVVVEAEGLSFPEVDTIPQPLIAAVAEFPSASTEVETKAEQGRVEGVPETAVCESDNSQLGDTSASAAKNVEVTVAEEIPSLETEMDTRAEAELIENCLENSLLESEDSEIAGANSPVVAVCIDGTAAEGEILTAGTEAELTGVAEGVEGGAWNSVPGIGESQLVDVKSLIVDVEEVEEEEIPRAGTEMELENERVVVESGVGKFVSELENSHLLGAESSIADKLDEDVGTMAEGESGMETGMEMETVTAGTTFLPELNNLQNIAAESPIVAGDDEDNEDIMAEGETSMVDTEMETEPDMAEMTEAEKGVGAGGKRKRGRISKVPARSPARKVIEEDVCFICMDGGELVLCDRRGCPKAYHPGCVNRDEAFFRAKGRWNCGWHLCSICEKNAQYMCYTCTFSLCKACIKDDVILCVRGNKGFCETCMETVMSIENNEQSNKEDRVDYDDKSSWMYLFKDYWIDLKTTLSLTSVELAQAKNPWKGSDLLAGKQESPEVLFDANNDKASGSDSPDNLEASKQKRRKAKKRSKSITKKDDAPRSASAIIDEGTSVPGNTEWASKELLEFVMHMKNGDKSIVSQFDVQALLLEYIKINKLRDPRRKSQIVCDARLENLFGKARVGHFEMLKLLESHFLIKEDSPTDDVQGTVVDTEASHLEVDETIDAPLKGSKDRRRKMRKKGDERPQSNVDDYAAIDIHNISLIYLKRKLVEDLLDDSENFSDKVCDTFVRIRISGSNQKQDMYRLVKVVGTTKAAEPYKVGKKRTDLELEILNLNKREVVSIDTISNQEFTEEECKRLRQSIKCGLIDRLTVGGILGKALELQAARVNEWLEAEIMKLSHLRDRASDLGRRKELRECVEKLQLLKTPEERQRRLDEIPEIHSDPNMHPSHESEEDDSEMEDNKQEPHMRPRGSGFGRKGRDPISPRGGISSTDSRKYSSMNREANRNISNKDFSNEGEAASTILSEMTNENAWNQGGDRDVQLSNMEKAHPATNSETVGLNSHCSQASHTAGVTETDTKISETEKMWHYKDPSGKVQGPFSIVQLRKWSNTGYFPGDLRIWRINDNQDDSLLLTDALAGRFRKELPLMDNTAEKSRTMHSPHQSSTYAGKPYGASLQPGRESEGGERLNFDQRHVVQSQREPNSSSGWGTPPVQVPKLSADRWGSENSRNDSLNLPSPTPKSSTPGWTEGLASESKWSSSSYPGQQAGSVRGSNSPAVAILDGGQLSRSSINQRGNKANAAMESLGVAEPGAAMNSGRQLMRGFENDSSNSLNSSSPAPNSEVTSESHRMRPSIEPQGWGSGSAQKQDTVAPSQTARGDSQAWGGASSDKLEPNPTLPVPVQAAAYSQWGGIPSTVQNPAGNFSSQGFSAPGQPDPWRPPIASNQSNIQPSIPPSVPWGMNVAESNSFSQGPRPENANVVWGAMQGNPNMAWGGPAPGTLNMNWGAVVQGPFPGSTVSPGWTAPTANPGAMVQGLPPGNANPGWAPQTGNLGAAVQGPPPGNGNQGWVASTGNPGVNVQVPAVGMVNPGWGTPTGNLVTTVQGPVPGNVNPNWGAPTGNPGTTQAPAPGNANPGWSAPAGNSGMWGNENQRNGHRSSGQRDGGFRGRDSGGFGGGGRDSGGFGGSRSLMCKYYQSGHCRKGNRCDMRHK